MLTRRSGGAAGDGVNIEESNAIGADYRGQRYSFVEAILHVPGLHVFPGRDKVYPAEYHIHMTTYAAPQRSLTLVIPVSHLINGPGADYFAAIQKQPDPAATRPTLATLLPASAQIFQYVGPDIRGRTKDTPTTDACSKDPEWQHLLVNSVAHINASDLERIPREGSLSTDPRDLPAPGVAPSKVIARERFLESVILANPGLLGSPAPTVGTPKSTSGELECYPLEVQDGATVVDKNGQAIDINTLLGQASGLQKLGDIASSGGGSTDTTVLSWVGRMTFGISLFLSFLIADYVIWWCLWWPFFKTSPRLEAWAPIKMIFYAGIVIAAVVYYDVNIGPEIASAILSFVYGK